MDQQEGKRARRAARRDLHVTIVKASRLMTGIRIANGPLCDSPVSRHPRRHDCQRRRLLIQVS